MKIDYEATVLGSILYTPSLMAECDLTAADFTKENYQIIYQAVLDVDSSSEPLDIVSVAERIQKDTGKNFLPALGVMAKDYALATTSKSITSYIAKIREQSRIYTGKQIAATLLDTVEKEGITAIDKAIGDLMSLNETRRNFNCSLSEAMDGALVEMDEALNREGHLAGVATGIKRLDSALGGFHSTDLIVVGARPSIGKTAFMVNLAANCGVPCGIISTEQGRNQLGARFLSVESKVNAHKMRTADLEQSEWTRLTSALARMNTKRVWINDKPSTDIGDVYRVARKWKQLHDIKIIYLDYIQHMRVTNNRPRHEQIEEIVVGLKNIARELNIPVVALAQVNRTVESRSDKRPFMSDLKDSGSIEQEADQVLLLYRDEVYNDQTHMKGIIEIDIQKNRHGPIGRIEAAWLSSCMAVKDLENREYQ